MGLACRPGVQAVLALPVRLLIRLLNAPYELRLMVKGENPWQVGISSMLLTFICGGSVAIQ